jgi:heterodisulfide reductase subunit A
LVRIGVFICHCGKNIARTVDCARVVETASKWPGVAYAVDYKYLCSDPGQNLIKDAIKEHKLTGVVISACSPKMHEATFRKAVASAGVNPYLCECANIREHCSWVHEDMEVATRKAIDLIHMMVEKVRFNHPLKPIKVPVTKRALVVGGGIAGIQAALDIADGGCEVILVEKAPSIGGHMAQLSETFPTLDCSQCILTPKMTTVRQHPNIRLLTYSEVAEVEGFVGNFKVKIRRKPRYVIEKLCIGCSDCINACVFKKPKFPDEFNEGLGLRKPIYIPFPQAIPQVACVDPNTCLQLTTGKCKMSCAAACPKECIDFKMTDTFEEYEVGAIILATGYTLFDAKRIPNYGYGKFDNVYTSLEIERMVSASGPTEGQVLLKNGSVPKSVAIIHCVGSRDTKTNAWCSKVCCMYSLKLAHLIKHSTHADVFNFYIDIRTPGKSYEEFYDKVLEDNVNFIRGRAAKVVDWDIKPLENGKLVVHAEDTLMGRHRRIPVDMVILSVGMEPHKDTGALAKIINCNTSSEGWFLERHPKLAPVHTMTDGVFIAGACQGPKDIPECVAQASATASQALILFSSDELTRDPTIATVDELNCIGCFSCERVCPYSAIERQEIRDRNGNLIRMVARVNKGLCQGCGPCAAICPSKCISIAGITEEQVYAQLAAI